MSTATHDDIVRLFPGIQDHAVLEMLETGASLPDVEAAMMMLRDDDESLIELKRHDGDRLNQLLAILASAGYERIDEEEQ